MANATIYDVAQEANVSIATVSRVLNTPHRVNEKTRQRVLVAIDHLGFVPKAEASARARRNNYRIGVLAPFFTYPSFVQRLRGVAGALHRSEYELVVYSIDSAQHYRTHLESLPIARRIDGLIVMSLQMDDQTAQRLLQHDLHTVLIETHHTVLSGVEIDNRAGGRLAAEYLLAQGHRRIAFIGIDTEISGCTLPTSAMRLEGFRAVLTQAGLPLLDHYIRNAENDMDAAYRQAHYLVSLPERPTAIFATSDLLAIGILKAAREQNLRIPDDLAILGFDDLDIADYMGLTTVRQSLDESGRVAVELLLSRLSEPRRAVQHVHFPLTIVRRNTA
ncbi:MAG: LacI family DNA-binding transcriptional regulator [Caldilineaceae bacterium]|nr:LacI family DNA-binding transcriptional regulator [Caldilineaceae bacterium]